MLTDPQKLIIKTYVEQDPTLSQLAPSADNAFAIAAALQAIADPAFIVWRSSVTQDEITQNGFDWAQADNLSVGQARIWEWLFDNSASAMNPSKPNVRAGISECWKGTAAKVAVATAVFVHCKRPANILEKLLATGTGTTEAPATMGYEGTVNYNDVASAMGWSV
jgi:hypothetical protein